MKADSANQTNTPAWQEPFLDILEAIVAHKRGFILILFVGMLLGTIHYIRLPQEYETSAVAVLLPREKSVVDASIDTSSIEATDDRAGRGTAGNLMLPPTPSLYTTIIMSRAVLNEIANRYQEELAYDISENDRSEEVINELRSMIKVTTTEEGIIKIRVTTHDPELSANIANCMFDECEKVSRSIESKLLLSQADHLDKAYIHAQKRLEESESKLGTLSERFGLIDTELQASNQLRSLRELGSQRDKLQTELEALRLSHTPASPIIVDTQARIAAIDQQMRQSKDSVIGTVDTNHFGHFNIEYQRLKQAVRFERDLLATIGTKADIYRIRANQPIGNIAIIRSAAVPNRPSGPSKKTHLGLSLGISLIFGFVYCIIRQQLHSLEEKPELAERTNKILHEIHPSLHIGEHNC